jgi:orotidine-5'-phosphate decarboxylase
VALDFSRAEQALALADRLDPRQCRVKIGKELFTRAGPDIVSTLIARGFDVFLDLKFHDIPNTVAGACRAAAELGVWMLNVHVSGGRAMLAAAYEAVRGRDPQPLLIGVTVLTSLDTDDLRSIGVSEPLDTHVVTLARLAREARLDGVVCSPRDVEAIRRACPGEFVLVTPGIRPAGAAPGDQKRVMTPRQAVEAGASYLVVGRPIIAASDPMAALAVVQANIETANQS